MKILFFFALLANLVFFLWQYRVGAFQHITEDETEISYSNAPKQIWLLSELNNQKQKPVSTSATQLTAPATVMSQPASNNPQHLLTSTIVNPAPVVPAATAPVVNAATATPVTKTTAATPPAIAAASKTLYCYQISGFANKNAVTEWAKQQSIDAASLQVQEKTGVVADYVVNYPPAATFEESKKNIAILQQHGINSFFMINHGEFKGAISLGVFRNEARAIKSQQNFIQKGIYVRISKRYRVPPAIAVQLKSDKDKPQLLATLTGHARKANVELLPACH